MLKALACCLTLLAIAIGGPADAQPSANGTHSTDRHDVTLPGSDEEIAVGIAKLPKLAGSSGQALLTTMETWVSSQFDLPAIHEHPRIEFAPPAKIASLRFTDLSSDPKAQVEPNNRASSAQHDTTVGPTIAGAQADAPDATNLYPGRYAAVCIPAPMFGCVCTTDPTGEALTFTGLDSTPDNHLKGVADSEYLRMISWLRRTCASLTQPAAAR